MGFTMQKSEEKVTKIKEKIIENRQWERKKDIFWDMFLAVISSSRWDSYRVHDAKNLGRVW